MITRANKQKKNIVICEGLFSGLGKASAFSRRSKPLCCCWDSSEYLRAFSSDILVLSLIDTDFICTDQESVSLVGKKNKSTVGDL